MKKLLIPCCLIITLALALITSAQAAVIFDGGAPDLLSGDEMTSYVEADDFLLPTASTLTDAHFWTLEGYGYAYGGNPWDGTLDYYIFADVSGQPGASPLYTGSAQNIVKVSTGRTWNRGLEMGEYEYSFDLANPLSLSANTTYWFGLHLASDFNDRDEIYWETTGIGYGSVGFGAGGGTFDNWLNTTQQHAFQLTGTPIPEPCTMLLVGSGLLGVAGLRRKFKK